MKNPILIKIKLVFLRNSQQLSATAHQDACSILKIQEMWFLDV